MPILEYNGNASSSFTLDAGSLGPGPEGVLLQLKAAQQAKISTTDYLMYGYVEATLRHNARQGLVAAFITMSNVKDEIDWEFTTANASTGKTNYFWLGQPTTAHGTDVSPRNFSVSDWHTYGLNWTSSQLQWTIDGQAVRTLTRDQAGNSYPRSPSRVQFSTWAGGNATNPKGTIEWAGGPIDWDTPEYKKNGFYSQEIKQFNVQCGSIGALNLSSISGSNGGSGGNGNVTSFVYTGATSAQTLEPTFETSTAPLRILSDPGADGLPGYPGYGVSSSDSDSDSKSSKDSKNSNKDDKGSDKDGNANSKENAKESSSGTTQDAIKYALPITGAIVGLAAAWAIVAFVRSRHLKAPIINAIGVTGVNDPRFNGPSGGGYTRSAAAANVPASAYHDLENESANIYRNEPNMNLMMGGGIMSDAGLSHLQRQATGSSEVSRSSSRSVAERLLRNTSKAQRYQQLDATVEEGELEEMSRHSVSRPSTRAAGPADYRGHSYVEAAQEDDDYEREILRYEVSNDHYSTPFTSPVKRAVDMSQQYAEVDVGDNSYEACQLRSPQRRALPLTPYTPNYATQAAAAITQRPSGRMYDTPNVNYYPTPVMVQSEGYYLLPQQGASPFAAAPDQHSAYVPMPHGAGYNAGEYVPTPPPRRQY